MSETGKVYQIQYPTTVSGKVYNVRDVSGEQNVTGKVYQVASVNGGGGTEINNQDINVTQNGIYQAEEGYTGLGTVNVNVASGSPTQKFGATIDAFLGDVDANGNYVMPSEPFEVNLIGVKSVPSDGFYYGFYNKPIVKLLANDLTSVGDSAFHHTCGWPNAGNLQLLVAEFNNLEEVSSTYAFHYFAAMRQKGRLSVKFNKLKIISGANCFANFADKDEINPDETFPSLEEITGKAALNTFRAINENNVISFSKVKKINGHSSQYSSTFGSYYVQGAVWNFPSATEFTGYIWNMSSSYTGEIHFAAANQAAIEACEGYANKWGFAGATIYFDL